MAVQPLPAGSSSQSSPFSPAPALPPAPVVEATIRTRGSKEDRKKNLKILGDRGASLDEMRSFLREFVVTDPYEQSVIDLWRDDPISYAADMAWNVPKNVWSAVKSIPGVIKLAQDVKAEGRGAFIRKLGDIVGKDVRDLPLPGGRTLGELTKGSPEIVPGLSFGTENLNAVRRMPRAMIEDYKGWLTPEGRSTRIRDRPIDVIGDVAALGGAALKAPAAVRMVNKLSKLPVVAATVAGGATLGATGGDFALAGSAAAGAALATRGRTALDSVIDTSRRAKIGESDAAQMRRGIEDNNIINRQIREAAEAAKNVHVHEINIGKIDMAGNAGALGAARQKAIYHIDSATNLSDAEKVMIRSAMEESVEARRAILESEEAARKLKRDEAASNRTLRERMRDAAESAGILNQQESRLARDASDNARAIARQEAKAAKELKEQARLAEKESKRLERIEDKRLAKVKADSLDMNRAARQRDASAREYANLMDQRNARLAAAKRERERFPDGREATGDATQTVTSSTTQDGVKTTTSQKFRQPEVEGGNSWQERFDGPPANIGGSPSAPTSPAAPSAATTAPATSPSRQAFDEWMKTKVSPLESNEMAPLTRRLRELERRVPPVMLLEELKEMDWLRARIESVAKRIGITYPAAGSPRNAVRNPHTGEVMLDPAP